MWRLIVRAVAGRSKWVDLKLTLSMLIFAPLHHFIIILGLCAFGLLPAVACSLMPI
jgi:hypothetical protein